MPLVRRMSPRGFVASSLDGIFLQLDPRFVEPSWYPPFGITVATCRSSQN